MDSAGATRAFVLGAVYDFMDHCCKRENPLVIGQGYARDRLVAEFELWVKQKGLPIEGINPDMFRRACQTGALK